MSRKVKDPTRFKVLTKRCDQCPFSENQSIVPEKRIREIRKSLQRSGRPFVCHKTMDTKQGDLVCRGYFDTESNLIVALARMLGKIEFIEFEEDPK